MSSVLRGGYKTTFDSLDSQFPKTFKSETDEYDYDSDSDIDGDEEGDENLPNSASVPGMPAAEKAGDVSPSLDRDIRDIKKSLLQPPKDETEVDADVTKQIPTLGRGQTLLMGNFAFPTYVHRIIVVYYTLLLASTASWKALLYYLCIGETNFSPLKSQGAAPAATSKSMFATAPPCSPKSMYRLADEVSFRRERLLFLTPPPYSLASTNSRRRQ